ncbi:ANP2, partial [Symbiodinium necroappetens]
DWGRCVWEQVKPFVQEFVEDQLDDAFGDLWDATINGYKTRLWALNATVYRNSKLYPNGTIEEMSNATRDRMYEDLKAVHDAMLGSIQLFLTDRAIKTTAGAYLSQFASLHFSVITQLLGSLTYRTAGDRYVFQTVVACYARRVYERATAAFKSRMSAVEAHEEDQGSRDCCPTQPMCRECHFYSGEFRDTWKLSCDWKNSGYHTICEATCCKFAPDMIAMPMARDCYQRHREEVANQTVQFWQKWLTPLPIWLDSIAVMQSIPVKPTATPGSSGFDCSACSAF